MPRKGKLSNPEISGGKTRIIPKSRAKNAQISDIRRFLNPEISEKNMANPEISEEKLENLEISEEKKPNLGISSPYNTPPFIVTSYNRPAS